jgi:hypothetical protein
MRYVATWFIGFLLLFQSGFASAQAKASKVFLLEDAGKNRWCSYLSESTWKSKVQQVGAMRVGTLVYSDNRLSQIDVTETDESGDWTVYDQYLLSEDGEVVKLTRLLNVLPGDRSVSETFSISNGKATKTAMSEKQLSTGKPVSSPRGDWLPDVAIETEPKMFPFYALLSNAGMRTSPSSCTKSRSVR